MPEQLAREVVFMRTATLFAERSTCRRGQVGAVLVQDGRIVSTAYNGAPPGLPHCLEVGCGETAQLKQVNGDRVLVEVGCQRAVHAESNLIAFAARYGVPTAKGDVFCTHAPCASCSRLLIAAGIARLVYTHPYRDTLGLEILKEASVVLERQDP